MRGALPVVPGVPGFGWERAPRTLRALEDAQDVPDLRAYPCAEAARDAGERSRCLLDLDRRGLEEAAVVASTPPIDEPKRHVRDQLVRIAASVEEYGQPLPL